MPRNTIHKKYKEEIQQRITEKYERLLRKREAREQAQGRGTRGDR